MTPFTVVGTPYSTNSGAAWIFPITGLCYGILTNVLCQGDAGITDSHDINVPEMQWFFETGVLRPVILAHPVSCTNDAGNSVQFSVNAVGPPFEGCQYQWLKDGTSVVAESGVTGVNTNVLTLADIRPAAAGNYQVVVANAFGSVTSRVAVLVINTTPRITAQPTSRNLFAGESASFAVAVAGPGPVAYQWLKDGQPLADGGRFSGATNSSLTVTGALVQDAGTYSVRVSNVYTNITSSTALLQVVKRTQTLSFGAVSPQVFQGDAPFIIAATASSGLVVALEHTAGPGSLAGNTFSLGAEGVVNIRGVQGGNDFYLPTTNQVSFRVVGQTPVSVNVPTSVDLVGAAYGDGMFVVVGDQNQSYASSNGVNWVMIPAEPGGPGKNFRAVTYGVGAFYAVAADKASPDNWRVMRWINGGTWQTVFIFGDYGIMHYDFPTDIAGSANDVGVSFYEARYSSTYSKWYYTPKLWRLSAGTLVLGGSSPTDSIACRGQEFYLPMGFWGGDGTFYRVVPGESPSLWSLPGGVERIAASPARLAGMSWGSSSIKSSLGSYDSWADRYTTRTGLNGISHVGHQFIGAGWSGLIVVSPDGLTWGEKAHSLGAPDLLAAAGGDTKNLVAGKAGFAILWTDAAPGISVPPSHRTNDLGSQAQFTVVATGRGPLSYQWLKDGQPLTDTASVMGARTSLLTLVSVAPGAAGNYQVIVSNLAGIATSPVAMLTVKGPPVITQQPANQSNVVGSTASFSVMAWSTTPLSYQWRKDGVVLANGGRISGATSNPLSVGNVRLTDAGSYEVIVSNALGGVTSTPPALLVVWEAPVITAQPQSWTVAVGTNVTFSVTASGTPAPVYQWWRNGSTIAGSTASSYSLTSAQLADSGSQFWVVVSNNVNSVTSSVAVLTVWLPPSISSQPESRTDVAGTTASFSVAATGTAPLGYQWRFNGSPLSGQTGTNLTLANMQTTNAGNYDVVVRNAAGSVTSAVATLTVWMGPSIAAHPQSRTVAAGSNVTFSVTASGTPAPGYRWWRDGSAIAGATASSYALTNVQPADSGSQFWVVASNNVNSVTSVVAVLTVGVPPSISAQPPGRTNLVGTTATFSVTANGSAPLSYQWRFNGTPLSGQTGTNLTLASVQGTNAGNYDVVVTNALGSVTSQIAVLVVIAPPTITQQPQSRTVPAGSPASFNVSAAGTAPLHYQWYKDGAALPGYTSSSCQFPAASTSDAGSYLAVVTNLAGRATSTVAVLSVQVVNRIVAWGDNSYGETNVPAGLTNVVAIAGGLMHSLALRGDGTVTAWGYASLTNVPPGLSKVIAIAAGGFPMSAGHSLALKSDGLVVEWPSSTVPPGLSNVVAISAGASHSLALLSNRTVVAWGANWSGQSDVSAGLSNAVAVSAGAYHSLALRADGTITAWGNNSAGQTNVPPGLSNVIAVAAGAYHNLALRDDRTVVTWGAETNIPAGLCDVVAVAAGANYSLALKNDGTVVEWASGAIDTNLPAGLSSVVAIAAGAGHRLALIGALPPTPPRILLQGMARLPDGRFQFTIKKPVSAVIEVQARTNLGVGSWSTLRSITNTAGSVWFTDPETNHIQRFYRLRQP